MPFGPNLAHLERVSMSATAHTFAGIRVNYPLAQTIPLVVLNGEVGSLKHDSVVIDQRTGVVSMLRHLLQHRGRSRVVFVGGPLTNVDKIERLRAFREVTKEVGLKVTASEIHHLDYYYDSAYDLVVERVRERAKCKTAVFVANVEMSAVISIGGWYVRAPRTGARELANVGYDDTGIA